MKKHLLVLLLTFAVSSLFAQAWKTYPNNPANSLLTFPQDEGWHDQEPIEWWYTNAHVVGQNTGHEYAIMMTFFAYDTAFIDGFRILNISDETTGEFKSGTAFRKYPVMAKDHLEIKSTNLLGLGEEQWYTKTDATGALLPFQYRIESHGLPGAINLDYDAFKPPLIVADSGYLEQGIVNYTYYYSQTGMNITGDITFNGVTEPVVGVGWIDRQYGSFDPSTGEPYEWFSLQLSNGMDFNLWNVFTAENTIPKDSKYRILAMYIDENTSQTISDFNIERTKYAYTSATNNCYANQWHLTSDTLDIDLMITLKSKDDEVLVPFAFLEGSTIIEGTIQGQAVTGKGFAELLHRYEPPNMTFTAPIATNTWGVNQPIAWQLNNPDEGRFVKYDLWVKQQNMSGYIQVAAGLTDTSFLWDAAGFPSDLYWFKVVGYSVDGTLKDSIETDQAYALYPLAVSAPVLAQKIKINPNPATTSIEITCDCAGKAQLMDIEGKEIISTFPLRKNAHQVIDISQLQKGTYLISVETDGQVFSRKWVKVE